MESVGFVLWRGRTVSEHRKNGGGGELEPKLAPVLGQLNGHFMLTAPDPDFGPGPDLGPDLGPNPESTIGPTNRADRGDQSPR